MKFLVQPKLGPLNDWRELDATEIDYVVEEYVNSRVKIPILYGMDGVGYISFVTVDADFAEIDGDDKREFMRSKLRVVD